jgi:hypothetical protein
MKLKKAEARAQGGCRASEKKILLKISILSDIVVSMEFFSAGKNRFALFHYLYF